MKRIILVALLGLVSLGAGAQCSSYGRSFYARPQKHRWHRDFSRGYGNEGRFRGDSWNRSYGRYQQTTNQNVYRQNSYNQGGYNQGGYNQNGYNQNSYNQGGNGGGWHR